MADAPHAGEDVGPFRVVLLSGRFHQTLRERHLLLSTRDQPYVASA